MPLPKIRKVWKQERLGLTMILASLAVIMVTLALLFSYQQNEQIAHIREQGTSLARVIARIPYEQLIPESGRTGALSVLQHSSEQTGFAYVAVTDTDGRTLAEVTRPGVWYRQANCRRTRPSWLGERSIRLPGDKRRITEFYAPLLDQGVIAGYVRLGYFLPGFGMKAEQLPLFAGFALPIFLLTPLFYFLLRREVRPFREATDKLDKLVGKSETHGKVELSAGHELQDFMERFNWFVGAAQNRIGKLEADRNDLVTSTKLLGYKRVRIESALQSFPEAVMVLDESGIVSLTNPKLGKLLGVPDDEVLGRKPSEWCTDPDVLAFLTGNTLGSARGLRTDTLEFAPPGKTNKSVRIEPYPLFSPRDASQVLGTLLIFRDVTAEKIARNSSGEFVAHVAHELKTPLNILAMYSESLLGEGADNTVLRVEAANVIHDEVERLAMLINNMLSISKIEMGSMSVERKRVKLGDLLQDTFDASARGGREKNIDFRLNMPKEIGPVALDKDLMRVAINNLLTNAIKYCEPGGSVSMTVEETDMTVRVSVMDNGIGISPEDQDRIFEKFYRSENEKVRQRTGHGLGLSLAREIIQLHHGTLTVRSVPGEGSEFIVEFSKEANLLKQAV